MKVTQIHGGMYTGNTTIPLRLKLCIFTCLHIYLLKGKMQKPRCGRAPTVDIICNFSMGSSGPASEIL